MSITARRIEANKQLVIKAALKLFYENGIEETTILQIAKAAEVSLSSIYRYFGTKGEIVLHATASMWKQVREKVDKRFAKELHEQKTGLLQVQACVSVYVVILKKHRRFYLYVHELDRFSEREDLSANQMDDLQKNLFFIKPYFLKAIEKGRRDGTIRSAIDPQKIYAIITYYIIGLAHKITLSPGEETFDSEKDTLQDFDTATEILLYYLKNQ